MTQKMRLDLGGMALASGAILPDAFLTYRTLGTLNAARDNAILIPSYYSGNDQSYDRLIGEGAMLDPSKYFLIFTNMPGNGISVSPSNASACAAGPLFPAISIADMVNAQLALLDHLSIDRLALAYGWSLGAMQSLHLAAAAPERVARVLAVCGTARCWPGNQVFLQGVAAALKADPSFAGGAYTAPPEAGLRAFGRVYAGWAYSAQFYRDGLFQSQATPDLASFLRWWEDDHLAHDANDLLCVLQAWHDADPARTTGAADWQAALARISASCVVMPCDQDKYFTVEEAAAEVACMRNARLVPILSPYGHCAGAPGRYPLPSGQIADIARQLLAGS